MNATIIRNVKRTPLSLGTSIKPSNSTSYTYVIDKVIGDGANSIVYEAHYVDNSYYTHFIRMKECYPYASSIERKEGNLVWTNDEERVRDLSAFKSSYEKLMKDQKSNTIVHAFDQFESNNTLYIVMDYNEGTTFDKTDFDSLKDVLSTVRLLAHVVGEYHKKGYLHLDIKPSNFLVYPRPSEHIVLFDVDSITSIKDIENKQVNCVPCSKGWAAPEQMQGKISQLSPATDIFSIGVLLFEKVMGRSIDNDDIGVFADWDFESEMFDEVNPKIKRILCDIFHKTIAANFRRRYQSVKELISALTEAIKTVEQERFVESDFPISDVEFVGRAKELADIQKMFKNGTRAVFLHAFGGVGKTTLAKKYAEVHKNDYDAVVFKEYEQNLANVIQGISIYGESDEQEQDHKRAIKSLISKSKVLLIIDNFDVEDDDELEYVLSLDCDIIFTSRNDYSQYYTSEKIEILELDYLAVEDLVRVFKNEYGEKITEEEEAIVGDIIERFGYVTKIVPIIAKQILASHITIEEFSDSISDDIFSRFDEENEDIRVTKNGRLIRTNSLVYIRALFNIAELGEEYKTTLKYLYLLRYRTVLTVSAYKEYTKQTNIDILNDLDFRNWISIDKSNGEIKVHQLIYDLVEKDYYPKYDEVPAIADFIDEGFDRLESLLHSDENSEDELVDWDEFKYIVFNLLVYSDIRDSENEESRNRKTGLLYVFIATSFLDDPHRTYKLLFESPKESTYYFYVNGIMDWFDFKSLYDEKYEELARLKELVTNCKGGLSFEHNGQYIEFSSEDEKEKFIDYLEQQFLELTGSLFADHMLYVPYFVMCYYFYSKQKNYSEAQKYINLLKLVEDTIISKQVNIEYGDMDYEDLLLYRVKYYLLICGCSGEENSGSEKVDIQSNYEFYLIIFQLLQQAQKMSGDYIDHDFVMKKSEELIIMFEEQSNRFCPTGLSEEYMMNYIPPTLEQRDENQILHWKRKADLWYSSVDECIRDHDNVYELYKILLTWQYYQTIGVSKIAQLEKHKLVQRIFADTRLTDLQKEELLFEYVIDQLSGAINSMPRWEMGKQKDRYSHVAKLYFECLRLYKTKVEAAYHNAPSRLKTRLYECSTAFKYLIGEDICDFYHELESDISLPRLSGIVHTCDAIEIVRRYRNGRKAKTLKNKLLQLIPNIHESDYSKHDLRLIAFKMFKLADECKIDNVCISSLRSNENIEQRWFLDLLQNEALSFEDREFIAKGFLDAYINAVSIEAYSQVHNKDFSTESLDEMEMLLKRNIELLLLIVDTNHCWYRNIFNHPYCDDWHRSLHPYWAREFHDFQNKAVNIGLCYLIAQYCKVIPYKDAVGESLEYLTESDGYDIDKEELQIVLDNIKKIYPDFKT